MRQLLQQFGITHILINAVHWLYKPCNSSLQFDRVSIKPSANEDLVIYSHALGVPGQCLSVALMLSYN